MGDFDVKFTPKPVIQESQSTKDGGAGNLGYFEREEEKKKKNKEKSIFGEAEEDTFKKHDETEKNSNDFSISKLIAQIIFAVKDWLKKNLGR